MKEPNIKGRGAQSNPKNPFSKSDYTREHPEGIDENTYTDKPGTQLFYESHKG